ncbi:hypothetical protein K439DRAFT_1646964 [Ramaria rubella]|nr:hypothetical protein K439DRAFT_1646964 [Ramaria rubella]
MVFSASLIFKRNLNRGLPKLTLNPIIRYENPDLQKSLIFKENINNTANAKRRLLKYYDFSSLNLVNMPIYKAILKYGHSNFNFEIIEYCREQYYLDNFDFEYNVLEKADSLFGYKHTDKTLSKMKGRKNALGYKHRIETITKMKEISMHQSHSVKVKKKNKRDLVCSAALQPEASLFSNKSSFLETKKNYVLFLNDAGEALIQLNKSRKKIKGKKVVVTNIYTNATIEYESISEAALALNITRTTLRTYIKTQIFFLKFKKEGTGLVKETFLISIKQ